MTAEYSRAAGRCPRNPCPISRLRLLLSVVGNHNCDAVGADSDDLAVECSVNPVHFVLRREVKSDSTRRRRRISSAKMDPFSLPRWPVVRGFGEVDGAIADEVRDKLLHCVSLVWAELLVDRDVSIELVEAGAACCNPFLPP